MTFKSLKQNIMTIKTSKVIINSGLFFSLSLSSILLFTDFNIINIGIEHYQISNRILFYFVLFIFQMRFFYLINFIKKNKVTHQFVRGFKRPFVTDAIMGVFLFCILPIILTFLNIYFNQSLNYWYLLFFLLYIFGTSITLISENQRRIWNLENKAKSKLYTKGLFKYARYINYFGETISQPALCVIATGIWWISLISLLYQLYDFLFIHIPKQEKYLLEKYKDHFKETSTYRKKLIPFIY